MEYTSLGWLGKQQNALPINNRATFVGTANSGISKTLCNLALSFWLWKSDELPTKKIRECCAKETQLSLISKIVPSCFRAKQNKQFGSNLPNIKSCKCDLIVNTTLQLNICKFVLHEKLITALFTNMQTFWSSKPNRWLRFSLPSIILTDLLGNKRFVICDWWILIRFVCFCASRFVACDRNCDWRQRKTQLWRRLLYF